MMGVIKDIAWSDDSKRLMVVGAGSGNKMGAVFFMDGGSSCGEIKGHSKAILSCDLKLTRPYKAITASEDFTVGWFEGPP
jgi:hypothetical protein